MLFRAFSLLIALSFGLALRMAPGVAPYADNPPPAHTGGFGEPTCQQCHFQHPLNAETGILTLNGTPDVYVPGERYEVVLQVQHKEMQRGGFELTARFAEGEAAGKQAGTLEAADTIRTTLTASGGVQYAHHTAAGTALTTTHAAQWTLLWTAPDTSAPVVFHAVGNAANDDASAFGDYIYAREVPVAGK